jgi:hypothetical protein
MSEPIRQFFGDRAHDFRLTPDLVMELERITGAGIGSLSRRFFSGDFSFRELTETLRLGLIGGNCDPKEAHEIVTVYSARLSVTQLYAVALPVIETLMFGPQRSPKIRKKNHG